MMDIKAEQMGEELERVAGIVSYVTREHYMQTGTEPGGIIAAPDVIPAGHVEVMGFPVRVTKWAPPGKIYVIPKADWDVLTRYW